MIEPKGFIKDFSSFILKGVPCSESWAELVATTGLASVAGRNTYISTDIGPLRLNLYAVTIGPSGISYKTTPLKYYLLPALISAGDIAKESNGHNFDVILPCGFSSEGMIEYLDEYRSSGLILRDEFTTLLKDSRSKSYASDLCEILSQFYDGTILKRYTRKAKLDHVKKCYINLIGTTTPYFYRIINNEFFIQGLGNRILYDLYPRNNHVEKVKASIFYDVDKHKTRQDRIAEFADDLAKWLLLRQARDDLMVVPSEDASQMLVAFTNKNNNVSSEKYADNPLDLQASYQHRMSAKAYKLSSLHAISRNIDNENVLTDDICLMEEYDAKWGINRAMQFLSNFEQMMEEQHILGARAEEVVTKEPIYEKVKYILKQNGGKMKKGDLVREIGRDWDDAGKIIQTMIMREEIQIVKGKSSGGRPPKMVKLRDFS